MAKRKANVVRIAAVLGMTLIIAAGCQIAGISNEKADVGDAKAPTEIRLIEGSGAQSQSRAVIKRIDETKFDSGEKVYAYVYKNTGGDVVTEGKEYTSNGSKVFSPTGTDNTPLYYPVSENVDIFVSHPTIGATFPSTSFDHLVSQDQSNADNYLASDLLYAGKVNQSRTSSVVGLTFYHLLSKIQVAIKSGTGTPDLTNATIHIMNTKTTATFTPSKANDVDSITAAGTVVAKDNTVNPIKIGADVSTNLDSGPQWNNGIFVPQTVAKDTPFIKVTLAGSSRELVYKIPDVSGKTFEQGKVYQYKITVNAATEQLTVEETIASWTDGGTATGDAE